MRKWNGRLAKLIIVLLLLHAMIGSFALMGLSTVHIDPLAYLLAAAIMLHAALGGAATVSALKSGARVKVASARKQHVLDKARDGGRDTSYGVLPFQRLHWRRGRRVCA